MEEDIKPDATDSNIEESTISEEISDLFEEGEADAVEPAEKPALTLEQIEQVTGRKFDSVEDFEKHYKNLSSFVGKKQATQEEPKTVQEPQDNDAKIQAAVKAALEEQSLASNPESKDFLDLAKAVARDKGISLTEAWNKHVKPLATDASEYRKGRDVGVNSRTRINPAISKRNEAMMQAAAQGDPQAADALVGDFLKTAGLR